MAIFLRSVVLLKTIQQAISASQKEIVSGKLLFRQITVEKFKLEPGKKPFDIAVAVRVGFGWTS